MTHALLKEGLNKAGIEEFGGFKVEIVADELAKSIDINAVIYKITRNC